jgi:hypothetical protein
MIQSNKIFRAHSGCWNYGSTDEPNYSENPIFKHVFFHAKSNKKRDLTHCMLFKMIHFRIYGRKIISRHSVSQIIISKIGFSRNQSFFINNLNALRYNSGIMDTKSSFSVYMDAEWYLKASRLLMKND